MCSVGLLAMALGGAGCSDKPTEPSAEGQSTPDASAASPVAGALAHPGGADDAGAAGKEPVRLTPAEHFARLMADGITEAQWDESHQALVDMGAPAADVLRQGLEADDSLSREWAASILALNDAAAQKVTESLVAALDDESQFVRLNSAAALMLQPNHSAHAVPALIELLESGDESVRSSALTNLAGVGPEAAEHLEALVKLLDAEDVAVRRTVIEVLGRIGAGAAPAVARLEQIAAEEAADELREVAQSALVRIRGLEGGE
ncbi:MAG: HEAT repeat domain-containing protein [Planctomycetaceae bacterium]